MECRDVGENEKAPDGCIYPSGAENVNGFQNGNTTTVARIRFRPGPPHFSPTADSHPPCRLTRESPGGLTGRPNTAGSAVSTAANRAVSCSHTRRTTQRRAIPGDLAACQVARAHEVFCRLRYARMATCEPHAALQ